MVTTVLQAGGQITIPPAIRTALGLDENDTLDVELTEDGILLRPRKEQEIDPSQAWFWTPEWQEGERQADEEIAAGLGEYFDSDEEFLAALKR